MDQCQRIGPTSAGDGWQPLAFRQSYEIEQILGKALGYPWYKDDRVNFPDATQADGVCVGDHTPESLAAECATRLAEAEQASRRYLERLTEAEAVLNGLRRRNNPKWTAMEAVCEATRKAVMFYSLDDCDELEKAVRALDEVSARKDDRTVLGADDALVFSHSKPGPPVDVEIVKRSVRPPMVINAEAPEAPEIASNTLLERLEAEHAVAVRYFQAWDAVHKGPTADNYGYAMQVKAELSMAVKAVEGL